LLAHCDGANLRLVIVSINRLGKTNWLIQ